MSFDSFKGLADEFVIVNYIDYLTLPVYKYIGSARNFIFQQISLYIKVLCFTDILSFLCAWKFFLGGAKSKE